MEETRDLHSLNVRAKLVVLHRQILFSLAIAAITEAILMLTSAEQVPSFQSVAPRYLKLVTSSNSWPFRLISALIIFVRAGGHDLTLFCADFHSICRCSVYESVGALLHNLHSQHNAHTFTRKYTHRE